MDQGIYNFELRADQVETLLAALAYVIGRHEWATGPDRVKNLTGIDDLAHTVCRKRVEEIKDCIEQQRDGA